MDSWEPQNCPSTELSVWLSGRENSTFMVCSGLMCMSKQLTRLLFQKVFRTYTFIMVLVESLTFIFKLQSNHSKALICLAECHCANCCGQMCSCTLSHRRSLHVIWWWLHDEVCWLKANCILLQSFRSCCFALQVSRSVWRGHDWLPQPLPETQR